MTSLFAERHSDPAPAPAPGVRPSKPTVPVTEKVRQGEELAIPVRPFLSTMNAVEVAKPDVEVEIVKTFIVPPAEPAMESFAHGAVVPMPTSPVLVILVVSLFVRNWR